MKNLNLETIKQRSIEIRELYHQLELTHHGSKWSVEEDALAFLTQAGRMYLVADSISGTHEYRHQRSNRSFPYKIEKLLKE